MIYVIFGEGREIGECRYDNNCMADRDLRREDRSKRIVMLVDNVLMLAFDKSVMLRFECGGWIRIR